MLPQSETPGTALYDDHLPPSRHYRDRVTKVFGANDERRSVKNAIINLYLPCESTQTVAIRLDFVAV